VRDRGRMRAASGARVVGAELCGEAAREGSGRLKRSSRAMEKK
jgi:hypothetical protein